MNTDPLISYKSIENSKAINIKNRQIKNLNLAASDISFNELSQQRPQYGTKQINSIIDMLCNKNTRLFIAFSNNRAILQKFKESQLVSNIYLRLSLLRILNKMAGQRKIGKNLRGLSKTILGEIENELWNLLEIEIKLFYRNQQINKNLTMFTTNTKELLEKGIKIY